MSFALAKIRADECIGCTKCIAVCPVDAIVGSHQQLHFVLNQECIGCRLCPPACPVDCIEIIENAEKLFDPKKAQLRHRERLKRLEEEKKIEREQYQNQSQHAKNYLEQLWLRKKKNDA